jgi:hypothetical protein
MASMQVRFGSSSLPEAGFSGEHVFHGFFGKELHAD